MKHISFLCLLSGKKVTKKEHVVLIIKRSEYYTCLGKYTTFSLNILSFVVHQISLFCLKYGQKIGVLL